ncbi:MAG: GatB/YqeY domain-containing protein [Gemmatimonadetes bacterium]|nr:GatB/YqeY domain-containing protein [Gemmatimonadota bacterium]
MKGSLKEKLRSDLNEARRARDKVRTLVLSTTLAELRNGEIETGGALDEDGVRMVVARAIKQRQDAAAQMEAGGREDLAAREREQEQVLKGYLPPDLGAEDVRGMVRELIDGGAGHIGAVMAGLMPRIRGRFDGRAASAIVREELG